MILGQKQLRPCQTDERSATVERMELTKSSRKGRRSLLNSYRGSCCLFFRGTIAGGSLTGNVLPQCIQSTIGLGSCTFHVFRLLANHCSATFSGAHKIEIRRAPRAPDSHNQPIQFAIQRSFARLKQHRQ